MNQIKILRTIKVNTNVKNNPTERETSFGADIFFQLGIFTLKQQCSLKNAKESTFFNGYLAK